MSSTKKSLPAESQDSAKNEGVAAELGDEALRNLAGYFDVLIQMDLAQEERNKRSNESKPDEDLRDTNNTD